MNNVIDGAINKNTESQMPAGKTEIPKKRLETVPNCYEDLSCCDESWVDIIVLWDYEARHSSAI